MNEEGRAFEKRWNTFIEKLAEADTAWNEFSGGLVGLPQRTVDKFSTQAQAIHALFGVPYSFEGILIHLTDYWSREGGMRELLIPTKEGKNGSERADERTDGGTNSGGETGKVGGESGGRGKGFRPGGRSVSLGN